MTEDITSAERRPAPSLHKTTSTMISVAILCASIFLLPQPHFLLATNSDGRLLNIYDRLWVLCILLQLANLWLRRFSGIVVFDYDWLFLPAMSLFCRGRSTPPARKPQTTFREALHPSTVSWPDSTSLGSSVPTLPLLATQPSLEDMLASRILVSKPSRTVTPAKPAPICTLESWTGPSSPYQRRSLIPSLDYVYGSTKGSPREDWYKAKEIYRKGMSEEVERSFHMSEETEDTRLRRSSLNMSSSHPPATDASLDESSVSGPAWDGSDHMNVDEDEEPWTEVATTLSMASSSIREFIMRVHDARRID